MRGSSAMWDVNYTQGFRLYNVLFLNWVMCTWLLIPIIYILKCILKEKSRAPFEDLSIKK